MSRRHRPFTILLLVVLSLLVLAPVQAEATSHFLTQLCAKINCSSIALYTGPKITQANSPVRPGLGVLIRGSGFGQTEGEFYLTGLMSHSGLSLAPVKLKIPTAPGEDYWTPKWVIGLVPDNITQVKDQQVKLQIKTKDNKWSNEYPVDFVARRDVAFLPSEDPAVAITSCSTDANWGSCNGREAYAANFSPTGLSCIHLGPPGPLVFGATFCGSHENCWACIGDDGGTDKFSITLKNGWVFKSISYSVYPSEVGEASASAPSPSFPTGKDNWQPSVTWSATPNDSVFYHAHVHITGPIGVPWK
jgi:hypothetical protein